MFTVDLSVGHGKKDSGVYDPGASGGGQTEQSAGDIAIRACERRLSSYDGIRVISVEDHTDDPNYDGSIRRINADPVPDLAVTVHHDWSGAPDGAFAHWYEGAGEAKRAADLIVQAIGQAGYPIRGDWHHARNLAFVRRTKCPAVLLELGHIGQHSTEDLKALGRVVADGIAAHAGATVTTAGTNIEEADMPLSDDDVHRISSSVLRRLAGNDGKQARRKIAQQVLGLWIRPHDKPPKRRVRAVLREILAGVESAPKRTHDFPLPDAAVEDKAPAWRYYTKRLRRLADPSEVRAELDAALENLDVTVQGATTDDIATELAERLKE